MYLTAVFMSHFRRSFLQLSSSPEAFLMLRSHFARTYGALCMCHYILGIGDRHLSNTMIDLETGGVIGIDFGHAFGSATQVLNMRLHRPLRDRSAMLPFLYFCALYVN